jgi:putative aldouronate transport system permease protein
MLINLGIVGEGRNFLMDGDNMWVKMWAWGTWKGLGWSAIIYIAGISSIDPQLYEAATVDGAGRFKRMWHITVPGLMPTFFVLLLLSIANMLSNGLEQYLVFDNPATRSQIQVLDLYIYHLGLAGQSTNIPLATMIGMLKSVISVILLFGANRASKWVRGETIV